MKSLQIFILSLLLTTVLHSQNEWFKYGEDPVLSGNPGEWDNELAWGKVIFDESMYKMWYTGGTSGNNNLRIGYATSPDGIKWTRHSGNPVLTPGDPGTFDVGAVGTPTVMRDGDTLKMWYAASTTNPPNELRIGYATSIDGINWTRENNGNPVLELGSSGEWDDFWVTQPTVVKDGSTYKMWYAGSRFPVGTERIGFAISPDGINWTKYNDPSTTNAPYAESDPVLEVSPGEWDNLLLYFPYVIQNNSIFEIWYAAQGNGYPGVNIGHATSMDGINWDKDTLNPVLKSEEGFGSFDNSYILSPSVILGNDQVYRMWYTGYGGSPNKRRIGFAATDSSAFIPLEPKWYKYSEHILAGNSGEWDTHIAFTSIIKEGTTFKMWYTGCTGFSSNCQVGYAESTDGGITWDRHSSPVLPFGEPGKFDAGIVGGFIGSVIYDEGQYKMWYMGTENNVNNNWRIGYATSPDGINWTRQNNGDPVLDIGSSGEWDDYKVGHPTVIRDGSLLKMWYHGARASGEAGNIGYATSPDGINWTKYNDPSTSDPPYALSDPVITSEPGSWDQYVQWQPCVILTNGTYHMWYVAQGPGSGKQNVGHAYSSDGINWNKDSGNPVITSGPAFWENLYLLAPSTILDGSVYKMWYTGTNGSSPWKIGFAATDSSEIPTIGSVEGQYYTIPKSFSLSQNYPNPFNPSTTISWQSPVAGWQTLKVFDLLGREVATLVNDFKPAGSYEVDFDASPLSSGTYFYRLQAGKFVETKKLLLLK